MDTPPGSTRCALIAILGRPNTGKSTLLNALIGEKLSIATPRPQTTRHRLLGARTQADDQLVFIDTPGIQARPGNELNRSMNREAHQAMSGVDAAVLVVEAGRWDAQDAQIAARAATAGEHFIVVINKIDLLKDKRELLPYIEQISQSCPEAELVPVSALKSQGLDALLTSLNSCLRPGPFLLPADDLTDRDMRFLAAEAVREKLMLRLGQEIPYRVNTICEHFEVADGLARIGVSIWVERSSQKGIVIGKGGQLLRDVGAAARKDIERLLGHKVYLQTWVKVREGWTDDAPRDSADGPGNITVLTRACGTRCELR